MPREIRRETVFGEIAPREVTVSVSPAMCWVCEERPATTHRGGERVCEQCADAVDDARFYSDHGYHEISE